MNCKMKVFVCAIIATMLGISGCRKNNVPDAPTMPATNAYESVDTSWVDSTTWFYTSTRDPEKEDVSYQFYWGDGETSEWSDYFKSGDIIKMGHIYVQANTYEVKVKSKDIHNKESDWSQVCTLKIVTKSAAPESVTIVPLVNTSVVNMPLSFRVRAFDPEGDSIKLLLKAGPGDSSAVGSYRLLNGIQDTIEHVFQSIGIFEVKIKAQDKQGSVSAWSLPCTVTITQPQKPPTPDTPFQ
ncbi:MAG: hypothetical protein PHE49_10010, partial [bacterium]|nr:hypothetical protein [bacterium]